MHELAVAREVLALVEEHARGRAVRRVVLEVGKLSGVVPDALRFALEALTADTPLASAVLELQEPAGRARCRRCAAEQELESPFAACACGSLELEWLGGRELRLAALELEVAHV
ncbi:MAG: hydrogenase maturation nickel metallochaperone HypA [Planctomycetota bacterium]